MMQRLEQSSWWQRRRMQLRARRLDAQKRGTAASESMSLVRYQAQLILRYRDHLQAMGLAREGVSILQWGAGSGAFVYRLLRELTAASAAANADVRYVVCDEDAGVVESLRAHPYLSSDIEAGRLIVLQLATPETKTWLEVVQQHLPRSSSLVVIANDILQESPQELLGFLDGRTFDASLNDPGDDEAHVPALEWRDCARVPDWPADWQQLVRAYSQRLDNVAISLPVAALQLVDACSRLTHGRYLLLATDFGLHSERQLHAGAIAVSPTEMAVNFDALSRYQRERGALVWNSAADPQGRVMHIAVRDQAPQSDDVLFSDLLRRAQRQMPGDVESALSLMIRATGECTCEQLLAVLRMSNDDPRILTRVMDSLLDKLDTLTIECSLQWRETLERVWANYFLSLDDTSYLDFATLAMHVNHWGIARIAFATGLAVLGDTPELLHRLSFCEASTGRCKQALALIQRACALAPQEPIYQEFATILQSRLERWRDHPWSHSEASTDGEVSVEPLGAEHAQSLLFQYRDPRIAVMTRLPELETREDVLTWLDEQGRESGRVLYAVMHASRGFIGVVSLRFCNDSAYFYFWIGADHQCHGFGTRAAAIVLRHAEDCGVRDVFTSVYVHNARSLQAMPALGFRRIDAVAAAPDDDLVFFRRPRDSHDAMSHRDQAVRLQRLNIAIDSPIRILIDAGTGEHAPARINVDSIAHQE